MRVPLCSVFLVLSALALGCSSNDDNKSPGGGGGGGAGGSGGVLALDCSNRCANKLSKCGAPASETANRCNPICNQKPTETELSCLEATDCTELLQLFASPAQKCGLQVGTGGGSGTGGTGGTDGGGDAG